MEYFTYALIELGTLRVTSGKIEGCKGFSVWTASSIQLGSIGLFPCYSTQFLSRAVPYTISTFWALDDCFCLSHSFRTSLTTGKVVNNLHCLSFGSPILYILWIPETENLYFYWYFINVFEIWVLLIWGTLKTINESNFIYLYFDYLAFKHILKFILWGFHYLGHQLKNTQTHTHKSTETYISYDPLGLS